MGAKVPMVLLPGEACVVLRRDGHSIRLGRKASREEAHAVAKGKARVYATAGFRPMCVVVVKEVRGD